MYSIGLVFDYHKRSRALHTLIELVAQRKDARRTELYSKEQRTSVRPGNWWEEHLAADLADQELLAVLNELWRMPGLSRQLNPRRLKGKQLIKYTERLLDMHSALFVAAGFSQRYALCDEFLRHEIAKRRWEQGMEFDSNWFQPSAPPADQSEPDTGDIATLRQIAEDQSATV